MENIKCIAGCKHFAGGEIKHHEDCPYYPESMSKMYDDLKLRLKSVSGSLLLYDLFQVANIRNEDDMPVIKYLDKPNGGSVAYIRYDAMVKKLNSMIVE